MNRPLLLCAAAMLAASLTAQQTQVVPPGMDFVEGPAVYTYPFGRVDGAIQVLMNASQVTQSQGLITGIRFRPTQQTTSSASYTKNYQVTMYTVTTPAISMVADLAANVGPAQGTIVFQGPLTLPATAPLADTPAPFNIHIPLQTPYVYDGTQGNLLIVVETTDQAPVAGTYRIDAVQFRTTVVGGIVANVDSGGCVNNGNFLVMGVDQTQAIVGGAVTMTHSTNAAQNFSVLAAAISLSRQTVDLTPLGMAGCTMYVGDVAYQLFGVGGIPLPTVTWAVPNVPALEGMAGIAQSLGMVQNGNLNTAVVSNAQAVRLGSNGVPPFEVNTAFRSGASWFIGSGGAFMPVMQLEGVFP